MRCYRSLPTIKAMTFDLDDTLYDNHPVIANLEEKVLQWMRQNYPITQECSRQWWFEIKQRVIAQNPNLKHDVTEWRREQIRLGLVLLGYDDPKAKHAADHTIIEVLRLRNCIDVPHETYRVLSILSQHIPLIAITNGNVDPSRIGLSDYFQMVLKAGPDGRAKPNSDMFQAAQAKLNIPASSILHIGDHPITDVYGAWDNGFSSCWFNDKSLTIRHSIKFKTLPDLEIDQLADLITLV
ncbi:5-amino-6-(5-phospho-D-ribitylamino)uracil phosphatase YigB [Vibrio sp. RC27]